jgi:hypothetical protein
MITNCDFCSTKLFPEDRECPRCGAPIIPKNIEQTNIRNHINYYLEDLIAIGVQGGDTSVYYGSKKELKVFGIPNSNAPFSLLNTWLNFESENYGVLLVSNDGWIYGNRKGKTRLKIYCKDNPGLETSIFFEVV